MVSSAAKVPTVPLELTSESALNLPQSDLSHDYGTPNLLFLYYIPDCPDDRKRDLDAILEEVYAWNAWELGQAELQLGKHVASGALPSDDLVASRITRNNYRSKAIEFFRKGNEGWYVAYSASDCP